MNSRKTITAFLGVVLAFFLSLSLGAQNSDFSGDFLLGFRSVNLSGPGAVSNYKEDYNLSGGARLYSFNLVYSPQNDLKKVFDRLNLRMFNLGGDPFETISASLQKYGKYLLQYDRRKANYFYNDLNMGDGGLYDLHRFDFDRVRDSGLARISLAKQADFYLSFDRFTKKGAGTTSLNVNRMEFEMDKPVQEESKEIAVGLNLHFNRYSFVAEEKFLKYKNQNSLFLPGYVDGGPEAENPASLYYFFLNQPYDLKSVTSSFWFNARPTDRFFLTASVQLSALDMDLDYSERALGVSYLNRNFAYSYTGKGDFSRNIQLYELDATYTWSSKLTVMAAFRFHNFDQTGAMTGDQGGDTEDFGYETLGFNAGVQYSFTPYLALTLGYHFEERTLKNLETAEYEFDTASNGAFGNLRWDISRVLKLTLDYEHSQVENPFALISPSCFDRLRITAKYQVKAWSFSGSYIWNNSETDVFDENTWKASGNQFSLRAGYHAGRFNVSGGFAYIRARRRADRMVEFPPYWTTPSGSFLWTISYLQGSSLLDVLLSYDLNQNWTFGGCANYFSNAGSWEIRRATLKAYIQYSFTAGYMAQVGYRCVDYLEKLSGSNNYAANIFEFSFGYRWN